MQCTELTIAEGTKKLEPFYFFGPTYLSGHCALNISLSQAEIKFLLPLIKSIFLISYFSMFEVCMKQYVLRKHLEVRRDKMIK